MALKDDIASDMKAAMKAGRKLELETLRSIRAGILDYEKSKIGYELTTDDELALLISAAKKRKDAMEQYQDAQRPELAENERQELEIIQRYLPQQMSEDELKAIITQIMNDSGTTDMKGFGTVMGKAMKEVKGRVDGADVQRMVKAMLGGA